MVGQYLGEQAWKKFATGRRLDDAALVRALAALARARTPEASLAALDALRKPVEALRKSAGASDPALVAYLHEIDKHAGRERTRLADAAAEAGEDGDDDAPGGFSELLNARMVPLLRQVRQGAEMQVMVAGVGKQVAVLMSRRSIPVTRRRMLADSLDQPGAPKFFPGICRLEEGSPTFVLRAPATGLARKISQAVLRQTGLRLKLRVRAEDGGSTEQADGADEAGDSDDPGPSPSLQPEPQPQTQPSAANADFQARLRALLPRIVASTGGPREQAVRLVRLAGDAAAAGDLAQAGKLLDEAGRSLPPADAPPAGAVEPPARTQRVKDAFKQAARNKVVREGARQSHDTALLALAHQGRLQDIEAPDDRARAQRLLDHDQARWAQLATAWQSLRDEPTPPARLEEAQRIAADVEGILRDRADPRAMQRRIQGLQRLHALPESDDSYLADFVGNDRNWFKVKQKYLDGAIGRDRMQALWHYRQKVTDDLLSELQAAYGFEYAAVGSTDLTSDIDVGVLGHGERADGQVMFDWQIVSEFNSRFRARFQREPGVFFDVNLYASAPRVRSAAELAPDDPARRNMQAMSQAGQDVGALVKQRRYMSFQEYESYEEEVVQLLRIRRDAAHDDAERAGLQQALDVTARQFSEADALYQIALRRSLDEAVALLSAGDRPADDATLAELRRRYEEIAAQTDLEKGQKLLIDAVDYIEHDLELSLAVNNRIYADSIKRVRELEEKIFRLRDGEATLVGHIERLEGMAGRSEKEQAQLDEARRILERMSRENAAAGLTARVSDLYANAVLFANEAYLSEGPMKHIVDAAQGARFHLEAGLVDDVSAYDWATMPDAEKAAKLRAVQAERRAALTSHQCLQSFNEQLGDLLKDIRHYSGAPAGLGFYRGAKYLSRLLDAIVLLQEKLDRIDWPSLLAAAGLAQTPAALAQAVDARLLPIRGGKGDSLLEDAGRYEPVDGEPAEETARKHAARQAALEAYAVQQMQALFRVADLDELRHLVSQWGMRINAACRSLIASEQKADDETPYFKSVRRGDRDTSGRRAS